MTKVVFAFLGLLAAYVAALLTGYFQGGFGVQRHHVESASFILVAVLLLRVALLKATDDRPAAPPVIGLLGWVAAAVAVGVFAGAAGVGFLSDDYVLRSWALEGRLSWENGQFVRPIALAAWRLVFLMGGEAMALHVLNIVLHALNTLLAAQIASRLGLSRRGATIAVAVFLLWPTQVEPVVWAAGIFDVMASTWMLLALLVCVRAKPLVSPALDTAAVAGLTGLAVLTKESGVALLALAPVALAPGWMRMRKVPARHVALLMGMICVTGGYFLWRALSGLPLAGVSSFTRYDAKEQLSRTFASLVVPLSADTIRAFSILALLFALAAAFMGVAATLGSQRWTRGQVVAIQGLFWCVLAAAPTLGFLIVGPDLEGSRYLYLAALGWGLTIGGMVDAIPENAATRATVGVLLAIVFVAAAVQQQYLIAGWRAAAGQRNRMLAEAARLADDMQCGTVGAVSLPGTFKGAQLFNNGFTEALQNVRLASRGSRICQLTWNGSGFVATVR